MANTPLSVCRVFFFLLEAALGFWGAGYKCLKNKQLSCRTVFAKMLLLLLTNNRWVPSLHQGNICSHKHRKDVCHYPKLLATSRRKMRLTHRAVPLSPNGIPVCARFSSFHWHPQSGWLQWSRCIYLGIKKVKQSRCVQWCPSRPGSSSPGLSHHLLSGSDSHREIIIES